MAFQYEPTATGLAFHNSDKYLRMVIGSFGSGKSCMMAMEILMLAAAQAPAPDGVRYTKVGVVRSSYPELQSSTRNSLLEVLPSEYGHIVSTGSPMRGLYNIPLPDGTSIQLELELWALLNADDCYKLRSTNWTFCWMNEATGCSAEVYNAVTSRIARFPSESMGGITWAGVIMDMNYPQSGTWLSDFIHHPEDDWEVFMQPPAAFKRELENGEVVYEVNPNAENLRNLGAFRSDDPPGFTSEQKGMRYYKNQIEGLLKTGRVDMVENLYCLMDRPLIDGKPVYSNFRRARHVAPHELQPKAFADIYLGMDQSGINPACVIMQEQHGRWCVLDELYMANEGFETFLYGGLVPLLRRKYSNNPVITVIDPSNTRDSWQAITPKDRLAEVGLVAITEISNSPKIRIQAMEHMLNSYVGGLYISPTCEMLIRGFESEYRYRRLRSIGTTGALYSPQPDKNEYSHLQDAAAYLAVFIERGRQQEDIGFQAAADAVASKRARLSKVV